MQNNDMYGLTKKNNISFATKEKKFKSIAIFK